MDRMESYDDGVDDSNNCVKNSMETIADQSNRVETKSKQDHVALRTERRKKKSKSPPKSESVQEPKQQSIDEDNATELAFSDRRGSRLPNSVKGNIHLTRVNLTMDNGNDLLQDATMDIMHGHRYGLVGRNGVGKSTLLRRLATLSIPGLPSDMKISFVQQQVHGSDVKTTLQVLIEADAIRTELLNEQTEVEQKLDIATNEELSKLSERLNQISVDLDAIDADSIEDRALDILKGLQFTDTMINSPTATLSGGWRMRLGIATALLQIKTTDLLLLDECTNHLDLFGLQWLIHFLTGNNKKTTTNDNRTVKDTTIILVSHDREFLDAVCTDIIVMSHHKLSYHAGNYSDYMRQQEQKTCREAQILDAAERQRTKAVEFVQKQQAIGNKKSSDPNKQRQAKMIKEKKLDRIGNYREDGKRYKLQSLKKLDEKYIRLAQKVEIEVDDPIIEIRFPNPVWPTSVRSTSSDSQCAIVRMEEVYFRYKKDTTTSSIHKNQSPYLLNNITLDLNRGSKVALVGKNGTGKSTLCKLIAGEIHNDNENIVKGNIWRHPSIRIGHVTQYSVEELEASYGDKTVLEYAEVIGLHAAKASATMIAKKGGAGNIRQYLGAFGLGGSQHAHLCISNLSGGERMRLCFASVLANEPHILLLDESTNHVDIETLESMAKALQEYEGAVLMVSHNQAFLSGFCRELWVLDTKGCLAVHYSDTESFDELFSKYRFSSLHEGGIAGSALSDRRKEKASLAKKSNQNKILAKTNTTMVIPSSPLFLKALPYDEVRQTLDD